MSSGYLGTIVFLGVVQVGRHSALSISYLAPGSALTFRKERDAICSLAQAQDCLGKLCSSKDTERDALQATPAANLCRVRRCPQKYEAQALHHRGTTFGRSSCNHFTPCITIVLTTSYAVCEAASVYCLATCVACDSGPFAAAVSLVQ